MVTSHDPQAYVRQVSTLLANEGSQDGPASESRHVLLTGRGRAARARRPALQAALTPGGALIILVGIVANLHLYLQPTSLYDTVIMLALLTGGLGLVARSLRAVQAPGPSSSG